METKNKRKKKTIMISIICIIVIAVGSVLLTALVMGKPVQVNVDRELVGVDEEIENILYYAGFAPNSHNAQMWAVEISPTLSKVSIALDDERLLDIVDPTSREAYISIGCYVETLRQSFSAYGYDTTIDIKETPDENGNFVDIIYQKNESSEINQIQLNNILKRHTDKSKYNNTTIDAQTIDSLIISNNIHCYTLGQENFNYLKEGTLDSVIVQSADQAYRDELAEWMRFSDKETLENQDGLPAEQIGLKAIVKSFYYWTTNHESAKSDKFAEQGIITARNQVGNCSAFYIITGENNMKSWVETGMETMVFWLECVSKNISVQPLSAMLETSPFADNIQTDLGLSSPVQMIIRAGQTDDYGTNAGIRRDLNEYVVVK